MANRQMIAGDRHGNLVVAPQRQEELDATALATGVATDDYVWGDGTEFFHVKLENPGKLKVVLIGDKDDHLAGTDMAILAPFREGWNEDRVWKIESDATNSITGIIIAGR